MRVAPPIPARHMAVALAALLPLLALRADAFAGGPGRPMLPPFTRALRAGLPPVIASRSPDAVANACGAWSTVVPDTSPVALFAHAMIYDRVRDRLLVFGGATWGPYSAQVWALPLSGTPAWTLVPTSGGGPDARVYASAIYDPVRDRMIVFCGYSTGTNGDLWALDLATATWTEIVADGDAPSPRFSHAAIYDASRDRMVVFGGQNNSYTFDDTYALSLSGTPTWSVLNPTGSLPDARSFHSAIYDAARDRIVVFGGYGTGGILNDVWSLSFASGGTWAPLSATGTPPVARYAHAALLDAPNSRMIVFGGSNGMQDVNDLWSLSLGASPKWTKLAPTGSLPPNCDGHAIVYDSTRQRLVSFGGYGGADQIWAVPLSGTPAWTQIVPPGAPPVQRSEHAALYDTPRHRTIVYGGSSGAYVLDDAWAYVPGASPWTRLLPTGTRPALYDFAAAIDSTRARLVVFGGIDGTYRAQNDVWTLSLTGTLAWTKLSPSGTKPPPRSGARAIYDAVRDRIVVYGGTDTTGTVLSDVWALALSGSTTWTHLTSTGTPPPLSDAAVIYDRPRDRMIVVAGTNPQAVAPTWQLAFAGTPAWSAIVTAHAPPPSDQPTGAYDLALNRFVLLSSSAAPRVLPLAGTPDWIDPGIADFEPRNATGACYDLDHNQLVAIGGSTVGPENDVRVISFQGRLASLTSAPPLAGTIASSPTGPCYTNGASVTFTAVPAAGYQFAGWSGDATGSTNPLTLTMTADRTLVATFAQAPPSCDGWRTAIPAPDSLPLEAPVAALDPIRHRMIAVGASSSTGEFEAWSLDLGPDVSTWNKLAVAGTPPPSPRTSIHLLYDPRRDRMLFVGSHNPTCCTRGDVYALSLGVSPAWTVLIDAHFNTSTFQSEIASVVYDSQRDQLVAFGGRVYPYGTLTNAVYVLPLNPLGQWTLSVTTSPAPPARFGHVAIYDARRDRVVVFGGLNDSSPLTDAWALAMGDSRWTRLVPSGGSPPAVSGYASAVWDSVRDRMVVFGGTGSDFVAGAYQPAIADVNVLSLNPYAAWSHLSPDGVLPGPMMRHAAVLDPVTDRMVVANGYGNSAGNTAAVPRHDAFSLWFAGGDWMAPATPPTDAERT